MGKVVVASDIHLGYVNSDVDAFSSFLDSLSAREEVDTFVVLGDFVDMWRRDASGVFLESHDILEKMLRLRPRMDVYFVAGNHDYHLLQLKGHRYPIEALPNLVLDRGTVRYRMVHGWEFDPEQQPLVMDLLCRNFSDAEGQLESGVYAELEKLGGEVESLLEGHKGSRDVNHLMQPPEERLKATITDVERRAFESRQQGEILIFGHTHRPFVSEGGIVANTGSWVTDAPIHNTYVELDGSSVGLFTLGGHEIAARVPVPG